MSKANHRISVSVKAYSGYKANERPLSFVMNERQHHVMEIIDRWIEINHDYFKVRADDGRVYLMGWDRDRDEWSICQTGR